MPLRFIYEDAILLWIVKGNKPILFRKRNVNDCFVNKGKDMQVEEVFGNEIYTQRVTHLRKVAPKLLAW